MVGFRCGNTLSENGSVARGVCSKDAEEHLTTVVERTEIMRVDGSICYKDEDGKWISIDDNAPVSMNMWGFTPDYLEYSEAYFKEFLADPKNMSNLKAEFFIPLMVNILIMRILHPLRFSILPVSGLVSLMQPTESLLSKDTVLNQRRHLSE